MAQKKQAKQVIEDLGKDIVSQIKAMKNPSIIVPIRALSNINYNEKSKTLELGDKTGNRMFFNVAHTKRFLQTVEVASASLNLINENKNDVENYIGGNGLIEMAFAHILNKKIYLLNPVPKLNYTDEIEAMQPIIINNDLKLII